MLGKKTLLHFRQNDLRQNNVRQNDLRQNNVRQNDLRQNNVRQNDVRQTDAVPFKLCSPFCMKSQVLASEAGS
jgi:hypothetical protein